MNNRRKYFWTIFILGACSCVCLVFALGIGSVGISFVKVLKSVIFMTKGFLTEQESVILFDIRLPRICLAYLIGGSLALSGIVFQAIFKNPLVEPYTLGVSGGAGLAVSLFIVLGGGALFFGIPIAGFIGALSVIFIVSIIGKKVSGISSTGLLLTGIMISFVSSSFIMLIMSVAKVNESRGILFWIMGNMEYSNTLVIKALFFLVIFIFIIVLSRAWKINAIATGDEEAIHLGIDVKTERIFLFIASSFLTGVSVSLTGMIGFVGLVIPHFARIIAGADHRILIPAGFLSGGIFLVLCDTIARSAFKPIELPVGVITGLIGGAVFLYFLIITNRQK